MFADYSAITFNVHIHALLVSPNICKVLRVGFKLFTLLELGSIFNALGHCGGLQR